VGGSLSSLSRFEQLSHSFGAGIDAARARADAAKLKADLRDADSKRVTALAASTLRGSKAETGILRARLPPVKDTYARFPDAQKPWELEVFDHNDPDGGPDV
jgi:hypothetical protein